MRVIHRPLILLAAILCTSSIALADGPAYPIKIHRPTKAGEVYDTHIILTMTGKQSVTLPDGKVQSEDKNLKCDLAGRASVTSIDAKGQPENFTITVSKFIAGPEGKEAVAAGKVITINRTETDITATLPNGEELSPEALEVLKAVYHPDKKSEVSDDEVFGSKTARGVGESWNINVDNMVKSAASDGLTIDPKDLSGKVTLKAVEKANGVDALRVAVDTEAKSLKPNDFPAGVNIEDAHMKMHIEHLLPVDPALPNAESHMTMEMSLRAAANGAKMEITGHVDLKQTSTAVTK